MTWPVVTTTIADAHAVAIDHWWRENRHSSPDLFATELAAAFDVLSAAPRAGRAYLPAPIAGARRLLLAKTRYHVYYVFTGAVVIVLAVWHSSRGEGPELRDIT